MFLPEEVHRNATIAAVVFISSPSWRAAVYSSSDNWNIAGIGAGGNSEVTLPLWNKDWYFFFSLWCYDSQPWKRANMANATYTRFQGDSEKEQKILMRYITTRIICFCAAIALCNCVNTVPEKKPDTWSLRARHSLKHAQYKPNPYATGSSGWSEEYRNLAPACGIGGWKSDVWTIVLPGHRVLRTTGNLSTTELDCNLVALPRRDYNPLFIPQS